MIWVTANNMDAGTAEVGRMSIDVSPHSVNFFGGVSLHILTVFGLLAQNLMRDTPLILFFQFHLVFI